MKVQIELDVPDDITYLELQGVVKEFHWLARLRGWRLLVLPPKRQAPKVSVESRA